MDKKSTALTGIGIAIVAFLAVNALAQPLLRGARLDVTQDRLYTLSDGARAILKSVEDPVTLDLYYTEETGRRVPMVHTYSQRVREFLQEISGLAGGKLKVRFIDPQPFSEQEDAARAAGLSNLMADESGGSVTFGLVGTNAVDRQEVIAFLDPQTESFLEYDVMRMILALATGEKSKIALVSALPLEGRYNPQNPSQPPSNWLILDLMRQLFEVEMVSADATALPEGTDVLFLAHSKGLSEGLLRAIDAYALGGGNMLILLDPQCESDPSGAAASQFEPPPASYSDIGPLAAAWGLNWTHELFLGDRETGIYMPSGGSRGGQRVQFIFYHQVSTEHGQIATDDPLMVSLEAILLAVPGVLETLPEAKTRLVPLLHSTKDAMLIETSRLEFLPDPGELLKEFVPDQREHVMAARLEGTLTSAFPGEDGVAAEGPAGGIVLVSDADFLADRFWVDARFVSMGRPPMPVMDNGSFVLNVLEALAGSKELMSLRGRGTHTRPFARVEELRRVADERYLAEQEALQAQISASEGRLQDLLGQGADGELILTPEIEQEVEALNGQIFDARKQLRAVQFNLRRDIDGLGREVTLLNVAGVPLAVALLVLGWTFLRNRKR
jgi:ABC-type uncharacterized transport system involved in gliding motility auxiliary subunit